MLAVIKILYCTHSTSTVIRNKQIPNGNYPVVSTELDGILNIGYYDFAIMAIYSYSTF